MLWLLIPLVSILVWRLYFKERVARARGGQAGAAAGTPFPGRDSMLYALVSELEPLAGVRSAGETLAAWLERACRNLDLGSPSPVVQLHYRYRFDPAGLTERDRTDLARSVQLLLQQLRTRSSNVQT